MKPMIIPVALSSNSYAIHVGVALDHLGREIRRRVLFKNHPPKRALVVTQKSVARHYLKTVQRSLARAGIESQAAWIAEGEERKDLNTVEALYRACVNARLDRSSCIVALGGGVVGDVAGFIAATYLRGISLVQVPTTLLAMVDSSIGGKTGVDLREAKNFVGAFWQPRLVWIDPATLRTLPPREFRNGMAEVIKYGIIADTRLFQILEKELPRSADSPALGPIIALCARIKARVVSKDEKETRGLREILNFGHSWGHAIETATRYKLYKHGEAISIGMCAAGRIAEELRLWKSTDRVRMERLIARFGLPTRLVKPIPARAAYAILTRDKKMQRGNLRFVLPTRIGNVTVREIGKNLALWGLEQVQP